jgi:hypothetical protein
VLHELLQPGLLGVETQFGRAQQDFGKSLVLGLYCFRDAFPDLPDLQGTQLYIFQSLRSSVLISSKGSQLEPTSVQYYDGCA